MAGTEKSRPDDKVRVAAELESGIGSRGPASFWRFGLVFLLIVVVGLFAMQWAGGNRQTAVQPGTPIAAPQPESSAG